MGGAGSWMKDHKKELAIAAAAAATAMTAGAAAPALAGAAGATAAGEAAGATAAGTAAAAGGTGAATAAGTGAMDMMGSAGTGLLGNAAAATPATSGISSGLLQTMGHMGPEQANILAEQNAAFGMASPAANMQTLSAANPSINAFAGQHGLLAKAQPIMEGMNKASSAMKLAGAGQQQGPVNLQRPPSMSQQPPSQSTQQIMGGGALPPTAGASQLPAGMTPEMLLKLLQMQGRL